MKRALLLLLLAGAASLNADHLPESRIARGPAETTLAGIGIHHHSKTKELIERLGKPVSYKKSPETEEAAEIVWNKDGTTIHATVNVDDIAYAVEVSGKSTPLARPAKVWPWARPSKTSRNSTAYDSPAEPTRAISNGRTAPRYESNCTASRLSPSCCCEC